MSPIRVALVGSWYWFETRAPGAVGKGSETDFFIGANERNKKIAQSSLYFIGFMPFFWMWLAPTTHKEGIAGRYKS